MPAHVNPAANRWAATSPVGQWIPTAIPAAAPAARTRSSAAQRVREHRHPSSAIGSDRPSARRTNAISAAVCRRVSATTSEPWPAS